MSANVKKSLDGCCYPLWDKPNIFILHCGLDLKKVKRSCEKLDFAFNIIPFRREEVFAYYVRLDRPRPNLIIIRAHFHSLVSSLNLLNAVPTIVVSTQQEFPDCQYRFIQADKGYQGPDSSTVYQQLALAIEQGLSPNEISAG